MTNHFTVNNLGEYIDLITDMIAKDQMILWYRGHADMDWKLVPKIQRQPYMTDGMGLEEVFRQERFFTNDFQTRASVQLSSPKLNLNEYARWLSLMQHYGLPTRLLDWSRSPLVALYFAVSDRNNSQKDACIWVLAPGNLNRNEQLEETSYISGKTYENTFIYNMAHNTITTMCYTAFRRWDFPETSASLTPDDIKFNNHFESLEDKIAACYPIEADGRVYNQFATFTVHNSLRKLADICDENTLFKITIPAQAKERLRLELDVCGITESYIFPDLEHLASEMTS